MNPSSLNLFDQDFSDMPMKNSLANKLKTDDKPFHEWYRFVLSFPPHLVRDYLKKFGVHSGQSILDPFCGTGTTIVEAKLMGINGIGIEANYMAYFASSVKVNWSINYNDLRKHALSIAEKANIAIAEEGINLLRTLPDESFSLLLKDSISPLPLHKVLILLEILREFKNEEYYQLELLALAKAVVFSISNLHFGPEVGVQRVKKTDAKVIESWLSEINIMVDDLKNVQETNAWSEIHFADSRQLKQVLKKDSIDAVFTSPPYPNEKDYTRTTRLESVLLGLIKNKDELRTLKGNLLRSNTRNVYKGDNDDSWVSENKDIQSIAELIEKRRIELNKTSGFERLYGKVTKLYFGGMARHLEQLKPFLKPGAFLGYVVGDQASYFQVLIRTGQLLADIAKSLGYDVVDIELFRTRLASATKKNMREEVVILRWPG